MLWHLIQVHRTLLNVSTAVFIIQPIGAVLVDVIVVVVVIVLVIDVVVRIHIVGVGGIAMCRSDGLLLLGLFELLTQDV